MTKPYVQLACLANALALCMPLSCSLASAATSVVTTDAVLLVPAPASLGEDAYESDLRIALIQESVNLAIPNWVYVDVDGTPGLYDRTSSLRPGAIAPGEIVETYILHFDPVGKPITPVRVSGSATFDRPISGLALLHNSLRLSDVFGAPGTSYPPGVGGIARFRELEFNSGGGTIYDSATISQDRRTLSLDWGATEYVDQLRVFIAVPEPRSLMLLGTLMLIGIAYTSRRRERYRNLSPRDSYMRRKA